MGRGHFFILDENFGVSYLLQIIRLYQSRTFLIVMRCSSNRSYKSLFGGALGKDMTLVFLIILHLLFVVIEVIFVLIDLSSVLMNTP